VLRSCHHGKLYYMATGRGHQSRQSVGATAGPAEGSNPPHSSTLPRDTYGAEITEHHGRTLLRMTPLAPAPVARP